MYKKIFRLSLIFSIPFYLISCTAMVWHEGNGMFSMGKVWEEQNKTIYKKKLLKKDELLGLVQIQSSQDTQLFIIGKKYGYKVLSGQDEALKIVNSDTGIQYWRLKQEKGCNECKLEIFFDDETSTDQHLMFYTTMTLYYVNPNITEQQNVELLKIGAKKRTVMVNATEKQEIYIKTIDLKGEVVGLNKQFKALEHQKFSQPYSIELYDKDISTRTSKANYPLLLKKIAATPFTLLADIVVVPLFLIMDSNH